MTTLRRARRTVLLPRNSCPGSKRGCEKALKSMSSTNPAGLATGSTGTCWGLAHTATSSPRRSSGVIDRMAQCFSAQRIGCHARCCASSVLKGEVSNLSLCSRSTGRSILAAGCLVSTARAAFPAPFRRRAEETRQRKFLDGCLAIQKFRTLFFSGFPFAHYPRLLRPRACRNRDVRLCASAYIMPSGAPDRCPCSCSSASLAALVRRTPDTLSAFALQASCRKPDSC
jgi:hypothetical protein